MPIDDVAIELFSPVEVEKYDLVSKDLAIVQRHLEARQIVKATDATEVHNGLAEVKRLAGTIEHARKQQVGPLNDQVKVINDTWRPLTQALERLEAIAKRKLLVWQQSERERIAREQEAARKAMEEAARIEREALARAEAARNSKAREAALAKAAQASQALQAARMAEPMEAPTGIRTDSGTTSIVARWTFKVVDPAIVPRAFLMVDEKAIRAAVAQGVRDIAGCVVYQEESLATRVG